MATQEFTVSFTDRGVMMYRGFTVESQVDVDSCECCGTRTTTTFDVWRSREQCEFGIATMQEAFQRVDRFYEETQDES